MLNLRHIVFMYLKKHPFQFILQSIILIYIGNLSFALETQNKFSIKGSFFGLFLIILSLLITSYYFYRTDH